MKALGSFTLLLFCFAPFIGNAQSSSDIVICTIVEGDSLGILRIDLENRTSGRIIIQPTLNGWPSLMPGSQLLFDSKRSGKWELYLSPNAEGSNTKKLTTSVNSWYPQFNEAAGLIAYNTIYEGNVNIALMDPEGSFTNYVTKDSSFNGYPSWHPQGTAWVFVSRRKGHSQLFQYTLADNRLDQLTFSSSEANYPRWSPDGNSIAFIATEGEKSDIHILDLTDNSITRLTDNQLNEVHLYWSANSQAIYFVVDNPGHYGIYLVDIQSRTEQKLYSSQHLLLSPSIVD